MEKFFTVYLPYYLKRTDRRKWTGSQKLQVGTSGYRVVKEKYR